MCTCPLHVGVFYVFCALFHLPNVAQGYNDHYYYGAHSSISVLQFPTVETHSWKRDKQATAALVGPMTPRITIKIGNNKMISLLPYRGYAVTQKHVNQM